MKYSELILRTRQVIPEEWRHLWEEYISYLETRPRFPIPRRDRNWRDTVIDPIVVDVYCFMWKVAIHMAWDQDKSGPVWIERHWVEVRGLTNRIDLLETLMVKGVAQILQKRYACDFVAIARARVKKRARG